MARKKDMGPHTGAFPGQGGAPARTPRGGGHHGDGHLHPNAAGPDHMAHPSHHEANRDHGTPYGFDGGMEYVDGGSDHHLGDNVCDED